MTELPEIGIADTPERRERERLVLACEEQMRKDLERMVDRAVEEQLKRKTSETDGE